ncbi:hypothetical protein AB6A40_010594, partial [Gnathostoma spinigerum]
MVTVDILCEVDRESCDAHPCLTGGICRETVDDFTCNCPMGYGGKRCETYISECASSPCENGAQCIDRIGLFECVCRPGFTGIRCHINDDDCQPGLCLNGGTCLDGVNSYKCRCTSGFTGSNCQNSIDVEHFNRTDITEAELCLRHKWTKKSGNGICDSVCNYYICGYDGGDSSAGTNPFEKCQSSSYCAHVFRDGKCDPAFNNEECLFDGFDYDKSEERCSMKEFGVKNYNNGRCDEQCNVVGCGWDGDDCVVKKNNNLLSGEVIMILLISPAEFL